MCVEGEIWQTELTSWPDFSLRNEFWLDCRKLLIYSCTQISKNSMKSIYMYLHVCVRRYCLWFLSLRLEGLFSLPDCHFCVLKLGLLNKKMFSLVFIMFI